MTDQTAKPARKEPPASPVLPLTRPVVAVALGALVAGGASLFLAGLATGLGLGGSLQIAAVVPEPAAEASKAAIGEAIAAEPRRTLVVGDLTPLAPPPLPAPTPAETVKMESVEAVVAALPPVAPSPAVPPRKPEAPPLVARTTAEGPSVAGEVTAGAPPADSALDSLESVAAAVRYALQTGAYSVPANADRQAEALRRLGYVAYKADHVNSRGTTLTIVYAGRYDSRETAESAADALHKAGIDSRLTALAD